MANHKHIGFFVTCLADLFRPSVAFSSIKLLEQSGFTVEVPDRQTCCGQPAFNSGDDQDARVIAKNVITTFERFDYVVGPSGSCMATIKHHYVELFDQEPEWRQRAEQLAEKCWEVLSFLNDVAHIQIANPTLSANVTYHDSCSGLRELGIREQPRALLAQMEHINLTEMDDSNVCCGFGGIFCVKYPDISERMVDDKIERIVESGADTLLGGDLGCLLNIAGRLSRKGLPIKCFHAVEVLAGDAITAIGQEANTE